MPRCFIIWMAFGLTILRVHACTLFVLTDTNRVLFCNNEDGRSPRTRIWFVPGDRKHHGCAFVGYAHDGAAQGGMNTEGLAFDWLAGWRESCKPDPHLPKARCNEQLLENCATVEEAIAFYHDHAEASFWYAKIFVADKSGASALIGAHDGKLQVLRATNSWGLGYGGTTLQAMLGESSEPTVSNGSRVLRGCLQKGQYATKYFNIFDVRSGDIYLFPFPARDDEVKLSLATEVRKGRHYYDMANIREQLQQAPRPLPANIRRWVWAPRLSSPRDSER